VTTTGDANTAPQAEFSLAEVHEAIAATRPDAECLVFRDKRFTWAEMTERTRRLANHLIGAGLGVHTERADLAGHESGQDHLAIYLHNGNEYLESMLGALKARVASLNVNYRYVAEELLYLLGDSQAGAVVVHSAFTPTLAEVLGQLPQLRVILQVPDESGHPLLPGAVWYEDALADASPDRPDVEWSPDDLYMLYTGGTTGMPKGVMWRNGDAMVECFGGSKTAASIEEFVAEANTGLQALLAPPFMHGAGHWMSSSHLARWRHRLRAVRARAARPGRHLVDGRTRTGELPADRRRRVRPAAPRRTRTTDERSGLRPVVVDGGVVGRCAAVSSTEGRVPRTPADADDRRRARIIGGRWPGLAGLHRRRRDHRHVRDHAGNVVLSADLDRVLEPGDPEIGWLAKTGRLALGYLGDPEKTARTYPVVDGVRYAIPGDRARLLEGGIVELHGRDSVTINSGGEKIFAEEVEAALKSHPGVYDCIVAGRPSERWGNEVVAIVRVRDGHEVDDEALRAAAARHIARYKLPKEIRYVDEIVRSPSGKADYRWAKQVAAEPLA
jgi:3-oxocholest-4-en-26-oate---CoA ligase